MLISNYFKLLSGVIISIWMVGYSVDKGAICVTENDKSIEIENENVRLTISTDKFPVKQTYFAKVDGRWEPIAESFFVPGGSDSTVSPLFKKGPSVANDYRLLANEGFQTARVTGSNDDSVQLVLIGRLKKNSVQQTVTLHRGDDYFHIGITANLSEPKLEYLLSSFAFSRGGNPDYSFVPSLKRADDDITGDRKFFAPAAMVEKDGFMMALVPDLGMINQNIVYAKGARPQRHPRIFAVPFDTNKISMPTALDLDLQSGVTKDPLISYGFIDYWVEQHMFWRHDNNLGRQVRELSADKLDYGFDFFIKAGVTKDRGYQRIAGFLWQRYGSRYFKMPRPQAIPFEDYAKVCYPAAFSYEGYDVVKNTSGPAIRQRQDQPSMASWQQWEDQNVPMGGLRLSAPQWYQFIYNTSWWNNAGDATGMYFWGKKIHDSSLIDKARRIIHFTLSAPQQSGIFPSLFDINTKSWVASMWHPPLDHYDSDSASAYWDWKNGVYQTSSASTTAAFLLQYRKTCEDDPGIIPFVRRYADFLIAHIEPDGCLPAWFDKNLQRLPSLKWNGEGGVHIWVLSELYAITKDKKYLDAAQKMAKFMTDEVIPHQRWYDFETFYSCSIKPESFFDKHTGQYPANTMSVCWAMEGFASLYQVTGRQDYLGTAQAIADYSIFYQAVWAPHYIITAYPYGGFSSQNSDDEWLDQRSHLFADALVRIGLLSLRQDLLERGVAAARASLTLSNLPEHLKNDIYSFPNFPEGLGPENIDHEGFPQMPLRSGPSWAEVGGLSGVANVLRQLGGAYIDFQNHLAVGVDGVSVIQYSLEGERITVHLKSLLAGLRFPYAKPFIISLHFTGLALKNYTFVLNDGSPVTLTPAGLYALPVTIGPDSITMGQ